MLGVVLGDHLRDDMTLITFKDGAVVMHDGKVGSEQDCCCKCQCSFPFPTGVVPHVAATVTFPNVAGDCPDGDYAAEFDLSLSSSGFYAGCGELDLGNGISCSVFLYLLCIDGKFVSYPTVATNTCALANFGYTCTIGNGNFTGTGPASIDDAHTHASVVVDGTCLPDSNVVEFDLPLDIHVQYTITF